MKKITTIVVSLLFTSLLFSCKKDVAEKNVTNELNELTLVYKIRTANNAVGTFKIIPIDTANRFNYFTTPFVSLNFPSNKDGIVKISKDFYLLYNSYENLSFSLYQKYNNIDSGVFTDPITIFEYSINNKDTLYLNIW